MNIDPTRELHLAVIGNAGWKTQHVAVVPQKLRTFEHQQAEKLLVIITTYPLESNQGTLTDAAEKIERHYMVVKTVVE